jgi:hypothetical protein
MIGRGSAGRLPSRACANNRDMQLRRLVASNIIKGRWALLLVDMLSSKKK